MRDQQNVLDVTALRVDMIGFIFYHKSPRYISTVAPQTPQGVARVGVFVDESIDKIIEIAKMNNLSHIQLHGSETPKMCTVLRQNGYKVIKTISISTAEDFNALYDEHVDILLFDTQCAAYGGSGRQFDWSVLKYYKGNTPFLLSGGIDEDSAQAVNQLSHPKLLGVDLNSRFEDQPTIKNIKKLKKFINEMNRIDKLFSTKSEQILSVFYPAGYPKLNDTMLILENLQDKGIDMVEIGIPFSDPMADGEVIQRASSEALSNGISLRKIFEQLTDLRSEITIPVILMGYLNPIMQFGFEEFCRHCSAVGVDGVIIPDLPFDDYVQDYKPIADKFGVNMIMLITPETAEDRIRLIDSHTRGFIYMVSTASTTGTINSFDAAKDYFKRVASMTLNNPRLVGFGVSNRSTFNAACAFSSGAIVGSHFVKLLAEHSDIGVAVDKLIESTRS